MRRIKKARIKFLSLVPKGANRMPVIYKEDGGLTLDMLTKAGENFDDRGEMLAVVYAPETRDSQGDIASAQVIKDAAYEAQRGGLDIDIRHNGEAVSKDRAYVAESFIIQKGDERFTDFTDYDGNPVDVAGGWGVVVKIDDPDLRKAYREGKWNGVSMGGVAEVEQNKAEDDVAERVVEALRRKMRPENVFIHGGADMTADELKQALQKNNEDLAKTIAPAIAESVSTAVAKAMQPASDDREGQKTGDTKPEPAKAQKGAEDEPPKFEGEPTAENLRKHRLKVKKHNILKAIDWGDDESVAKAEKELAEVEKELNGSEQTEETETAEKSAEDERIKKLEAELDRLKKGSRQPVSSGGGSEQESGLMGEGISKEDQEAMQAGMEMAKWANEHL